MNLYTPGKLSFRLALLITLVFSAAWALLNVFVFHATWWHLGLLAGLIFGISWFLGYFMFNLFLYHRIRTIYKTIGSKSIPEGLRETQKMLNHPEFIENLEAKVYEWAQSKNSELEGLKKQEQFRREFIGNLSHELKTPIFNIQGYILTLIDGGLDDKVVNIEYLKRAEKSINRMIAIINDLDSIARLDLEGYKLQITKFDIHALANEVIESYQNIADEKDLRLVSSTSGKGSVYVSGDKNKIRQVLNNLVENSIHYGKQGGNTRITYADMDEHILIEVTDNGAGIRENELPRIFERFYRTSAGRAAAQNGSGLGLAIVKHIIEAHQQNISVQSAPGKGTTFSFTLRKA